MKKRESMIKSLVRGCELVEVTKEEFYEARKRMNHFQSVRNVTLRWIEEEILDFLPPPIASIIRHNLNILGGDEFLFIPPILNFDYELMTTFSRLSDFKESGSQKPFSRVYKVNFVRAEVMRSELGYSILLNEGTLEGKVASILGIMEKWVLSSHLRGLYRVNERWMAVEEATPRIDKVALNVEQGNGVLSFSYVLGKSLSEEYIFTPISSDEADKIVNFLKTKGYRMNFLRREK